MDIKLGTKHLPTAAVEVPFTLAIWSMTDKKDPRKGAVSVGLLFGQHDNPADLTPAERAYVLAILEHVIAEFEAGEIPTGKKGSSEDWESKYFFAGYPPYTQAAVTKK